MPIYDIKVQNLSQLPRLGNIPVVSDCDGTLFEHGTTNLYPDVADSLASVECLALVSAHPDQELLHQRKQILDAELSINSDKPIWYKGKLFNRMAQNLGKISNKVIILGDRPLADVGVAKYIFAKHSIDTLGVRVDRPHQPYPSRVDYALTPILKFGSAVLKATGHDKYFRPCEDEGLQRANQFLGNSD